ncbi:MAG: hypothetical protein ABI365_00895 [Lysobacteraceae bacterium]
MMNLHWFDFVGFIGVLMVLGAYAGQQTRRINGDSALYSLLNLVGASGILVPVLYAAQLNWSVLFIESAWILISVYGIYHVIARRLSKSNA